MKIKFIWGVLPVFVSESKDELGHAKGPFLQVPNNDKVILAHEIFHAKQWYVFALLVTAIIGSGMAAYIYIVSNMLINIGSIALALCAAIWYNKHSFENEIAAYGESLREIDRLYKPNPGTLESYLKSYVMLLNSDLYDDSMPEILLEKKLFDKYRSGDLF